MLHNSLFQIPCLEHSPCVAGIRNPEQEPRCWACARLDDGDARLADEQRLLHGAPLVQLAHDGLQVPAGIALLALREPCRKACSALMLFVFSMLLSSAENRRGSMGSYALTFTLSG